MSANTSRERQLRLERKRRRRAERKTRQQVQCDGRESPVQEFVWSQQVVVAPEGREASPRAMAAFDALGRMSDALMKLAEPYIYWPPAPGEIPALRAWLELGARVWNAVVRAGPGDNLDAALEVIQADWELLEEEEPVALKRELAERKRRLFSHDFRLVSHVRVWEEGKMAMVEAGTLTYVR